MADLTAERDAEYVRHAGPVLVTYTRQVLMEVDLLRLRKASEAEGDTAAVAWLDAMEAARLAFADMQRARDRAEAAKRAPVPTPIPAQVQEGTA